MAQLQQLEQALAASSNTPGSVAEGNHHSHQHYAGQDKAHRAWNWSFDPSRQKPLAEQIRHYCLPKTVEPISFSQSLQ
jgi:hypothetical protein